MCINSCGINAYVEDGKLVKVEGMRSTPSAWGRSAPGARPCPSGSIQRSRLTHPMRKKTDGGWERITWEWALDTIAQKLKEIKQKYGAQALAVYSGSIGTENIELAGFAQRFRGVYGTPNLLSVEGNCFRSRIMARQMTFGAYPIEEPWNARCLIVWGQNMDNSRMTIAHKIYKAMDAGTLKHLIVVDPKRTSIAEKANPCPDQTGHRYRPGTGVDERYHRRRPLGQGVHREELYRFRQAHGARQGIHAGEGVRDHLDTRRRYSEDRTALRHHQTGLHQPGHLLHRPARQRFPEQPGAGHSADHHRQRRRQGRLGKHPLHSPGRPQGHRKSASLSARKRIPCSAGSGAAPPPTASRCSLPMLSWKANHIQSKP